MDIFEEAEIRYPSRTFSQDEEEQAVPTSSLKLEPSIVLWNVHMQPTQGQKLQAKLLIVAADRVACAVLNNSWLDKKAVGSVLLPGISLSGNTVAHSHTNRTCIVYALDETMDILLACCQYDVPGERAVAWARGLMGSVAAEHVLVLGGMQAERYCGPLDPSQDFVVHLLQSSVAGSAASQQGVVTKPPVPFMPTGNVVPGLPAALLAYCQVRNIAAHVLVGVHMVPGMMATLVEPMANAARAVLSSAGFDSLLGGIAGGAGVRKAQVEVNQASPGITDSIFA